jgi:membrane associated rhomboid family serine protease
MGLYDREYYRQERPAWTASGPRSAVGVLIILNAAVWVVDAFFANGELANNLAATVGTLTRPWLWWQFLTYGFLHDPRNIGHILANMAGLFFLGRDIEDRYGTKEFVRLYLAMIVVGGVLWAAVEHVHGARPDNSVVGASGAIAGIVVLYAFNFPRRTLMLWFVVPLPAWLLGLLLVAYDAYGAIAGPGGSNVAFVVHLGGAAFAAVYYLLDWNFGRWWPGGFSLRWPRRRPKLRVHAPDAEEEQSLSDEVDRILEKISREGESSLTRQERRTLETASRQYQKRRQNSDDRTG